MAASDRATFDGLIAPLIEPAYRLAYAQHWITADGASISETFDAGKTWTAPQQVLARGLSFSLSYWNYINSSVIWAQVGPNMLVRSTDGGAHWTAVPPPTIK